MCLLLFLTVPYHFQCTLQLWNLKVRLEQLEEKLGSYAGYSLLSLPEKNEICVALIEAEMEDGTTDISYLRAKIVDIQDDMVCVLNCFFF